MDSIFLSMPSANILAVSSASSLFIIFFHLTVGYMIFEVDISKIHIAKFVFHQLD